MKFSNAVKTALPAAILGCLTLCFAPTASAAGTGTATTSFGVSATVIATCTVSATPLGFGNYTSTTTSNSKSTISVTCTNGTTYDVGLNGGTTTGGTPAARLMAGSGTAAGSTLSYNLCSDSEACKTNWGNTSDSWQTGTGSGLAQSLTVFGQIPANQFVATGSYGDTIGVTVTY